MNDTNIEQTLQDLRRLTTSDFKSLHDNVLKKLDRLRQQHGLKTNSSTSLLWLRQAVRSIRSLKKVNPKRSFLLSSTEINHNLITPKGFKRTGEMFFFEYLPNTKNRNILNHWDRFPMVLIVEIHDDGFSGINLHYLPIKYRERLFLQLIRLLSFKEDIIGIKKYRSRASIPRIRTSYKMLSEGKRFHLFKPAYKRYKYSRIRSKMLLIEPNYWDIAMFMLLDRFQKEQRSSVWLQSEIQIKEQIRNR